MKLARSIILQDLLTDDVSKWPEHIPEKCPQCSSEMSSKVNLFVGESKQASFIKRASPWLSVLILLVVIIFMAFVPAQVVNGGQGTSMALVAIILLPPTLLTIIANGMPEKYKVQCHQCKCLTDYKLSLSDK